jgi:nucleoid-associated protein YgaU
MSVAKPWTFTQVAGDQKVLTLAGEGAPHGRARVSPVVEDEMGLRDVAVYYPGNPRPTRHVFGEIHTDWVLTGRFADRFLGPGGAKAKIEEIKAFIADEQQVTIAWGDILAATGLVRRIKPSRESESEIAWTLTVGIDGDDALPPAAPQSSAVAPGAKLGQLSSGIGAINALTDLPGDLGLAPDFLDSLGDLVSQINSVSASVLSIADGISNFETAVAGDLNRFRAGLQQFQTAVLTLQATLESAQNDFSLTESSSLSEDQWHATRAEAECEALAMAALLAAVDRDVEIIQKGRQATTCIATAGDTWESLSTRYYGGPSKADTLRKANGAQYGAQPQAGRLLQIPEP